MSVTEISNRSTVTRITGRRGRWSSVGIVFLWILIGATTLLRAQGVRYENIVVPGPRRGPVAAAKIALCAAGASTSSAPCSPLATIYSDEALTQPMANPMQVDSLGNYGFWATPGHYIVQIYGTGLSTRTMNVFLPCDPSNCSMSNATFSSITAGTLNLTRALTVNGKSVATEGETSDAVLYVSPNGSDSDSGLSWGSAKRTLYAAVATIQHSTPGGGTVYVAAGTSCGGPVSGQGLWLIGAGDSHFSSPPSGWIKVSHSMQIVGVGVNGTPVQNAPSPGVAVNCGSSNDNPPLWLTGMNSFKQISFDNLIFNSNANNALKIGISPDGNRTTSNTTGLVFEGDSFQVGTGGSVGPTVDIGANTFWIWFDHCAFSADSGAAPLSDAHQAVVVNATSSGTGDSLIFFNHTIANFGGLHWYGYSSTGSFSVHDLTAESINEGSPAVWVTSASNFAGPFDFRNIGVADATVNPTYAVKIDGGITATGDTEVSGAYGNGIDTSGPMTILTQYPEHIQNETHTPYTKGQIGFEAGRIWAQDDSSRREFGPVASRFTNQAKQLPSQWMFSYGSSSATTVPAPDGTSNAGKIPASSGYDFVNLHQAVATGDYIIGGAWIRNPNGSGSDPSGVAYNIGISGCSPGPDTDVTATALLPNGSTDSAGAGYIQMGASGEWEWFPFAEKVTVTGAQTCYVSMQLVSGSTQQMEAYAPVLYYVPAGTISDDEAAYIGMTLAPYPDSLTPPVEATLRGHPFAFGGSGDNYFATLDHTALTANRTYSFPDANGPVCLATTCGVQVGQISISGDTSASHSFGTSYQSPPICVVSPSSNPGSVTWWVTSSTSSVTVTLSTSATITFNYSCSRNPD